MAKKVKIKKLKGDDGTDEPEREYFCHRCGSKLYPPIDKTAVYVWDGQKTALIDTKCVRAGDLYIWGNNEVLE